MTVPLSDRTVPATDYEHESACSFINPRAEVSAEFVRVLERVGDLTDRTYDFGAAGCGGCFHTDADVGAYWVAQNDATDTMPVGYGANADDVSRRHVGALIMQAAKEHGVAASWTGDPSDTVVLGTATRYD